MNWLRRAEERRHDRRGKQDTWLTFYPQEPATALDRGFGALESLNEIRLGPGAHAVLQMQQDAESVTYVREGGLTFADSAHGKAGAALILAGEYRSMTGRRSVWHEPINVSRSLSVSFFQIRLRSTRLGSAAKSEQRRFDTAERRGRLRVVGSPDGREGSLRVRQDVAIWSGLLDPGRHVVHPLAPGRQAWLHIVRGEAVVGEVLMATGDGAGVTDEIAISLTARQMTEVLLIEVGEQHKLIPSE